MVPSFALVAQRSIFRSREVFSRGVWGHLRQCGTIHRMVPRVLLGPSGGYLYLHFHIVYMACRCEDLSLSGQVCAGDFPFPVLLNRELVRSLSPLAARVLRRECGDAPKGASRGRAGDALVECGD